MRRKSMAIVCVLAMLCGSAGCGKTGSDKGTELTVLTEAAFRNQVESMAKFAEQMDSDLKVHIEVLPTKKEERETEIQKLRTEIMAGKGADLYLMDTDVENAAEPMKPLFENPYKTMQSGAFASLDRYMKDDPYWEEGTYKKELLEAGQYEKKQYIVPLSCYYPVLIGGQGAEEMRGETLAEWIEQMKGSDDEGLQQAARSLRLWTGGRWFEPAVDYEKQEVLFDQEKWTGFAADYLELEEVYRDSGTDSGDLKYNIEYISLQTEQNGIRFLQNIPDINGKKTATVKGYAAIGMSGDHKKEAYDLMMLFLNQGITDKNAREGQQEHALGRIDESGFPVQERAIGSDGERTMTLETFRQIDGAYFITDVERMLYTSLEEAAYSMYEPGFDAEAGWEAVVSPIADKAWNDYKVQMSE